VVPVQLRFPATIAARILLPSSADVEVLSPAEVRDDLRSTAGSIATAYVAK
jgi:predicted DNA-binding transcriptional regulator YafY